MIGVIDLHCWTCGNVQLHPDDKCSVCGGKMTPQAPLQEEHERIVKMWEERKEREAKDE